MKRSITPPLAGIAYAVLAVVGTLLVTTGEADTKTDQEILTRYADSGNRAGDIVGFLLVAVGAAFLLWFVSALRHRLRADPESASLADLGFAAGISASGLVVVAAALFAGTAFTAAIADEFTVVPDVTRLAVATGYLLLIGGAVSTAVLVATTSIAAFRTGVLPRWVGWVGAAAIALAIPEAFLLPVFVVPAWAVIVSVAMVMTPEQAPRRDIDVRARAGEPVATG